MNFKDELELSKSEKSEITEDTYSFQFVHVSWI